MAGVVTGEDEEDPDYIAQRPPAEVCDPRNFFQEGAHKGNWLEYDERGVPTKNIKKKKPTKKEKDELEQEYLKAKNAHANYLKDVAAWEQKKIDAEAALQRRDRFRWSFRQIGEVKNDPINVSEYREVMLLMGWDHLKASELDASERAVAVIANSSGKLELEALRAYTKEKLPQVLMEERLRKKGVKDIVPTDTYSPRTWRRKLEEAPDEWKKEAPAPPRSPRGLGSKSPRGARSPRGGSKEKTDGSPARSPRGKKEKGSGGGSSPRGGGGSSPRGGGGGSSPRRGSKNKSKS